MASKGEHFTMTKEEFAQYKKKRPRMGQGAFASVYR